MRTPTPSEIQALVGIPFINKGRDPKIGLDCWGLAKHASKTLFGIIIPSYSDKYEFSNGDDASQALINNKGFPWGKVPSDKIRPGDLLECRILDKPWHVGILVAPGLMLHTQEGTGSITDSILGIKWAHRISGYYRWLA